MTEARVGYHKEVKNRVFSGKSITVEILIRCSLLEHGISKREIESCLYEGLCEVCAGTGADALMRDILRCGQRCII